MGAAAFYYCLAGQTIITSQTQSSNAILGSSVQKECPCKATTTNDNNDKNHQHQTTDCTVISWGTYRQHTTFPNKAAITVISANGADTKQHIKTCAMQETERSVPPLLIQQCCSFSSSWSNCGATSCTKRHTPVASLYHAAEAAVTAGASSNNWPCASKHNRPNKNSKQQTAVKTVSCACQPPSIAINTTCCSSAEGGGGLLTCWFSRAPTTLSAVCASQSRNQRAH